MTAPGVQFPVVIVGSGPAGLTLANWLGTLGVHALLIEKNAETVHEPRAISIDDESLRTMQAIGMIDAVRPQIVAGYGSHYYSATGACFTRVEPTGEPYGYPRRNAFRQPDLEHTLQQGLARFAHIETRYGCRLVDFSQDDAGVTLQVERDGAAEVLRCAYLVGCDGARSLVRDKLEVVLEGTTFDERWLIVDVNHNVNALKHTKVFCDPARPCITLPGPFDTRRWEFKLFPYEKDEDFLRPETVQELIMTHDAAPEAQLVRKVVYRFHARVAKRWSQGRVFMAGDAVHLTPPFAGQGMNSGVRDVHNLGWKLAAVLGNVAGPGLLASYGRERYGHVWDMIRLALRMGRVFAPRNWLDALLQQSFFRALRVIPGASDYISQMRYKPAPRFREGFLLPDGLSPRHTRVGRLIPQPRVRNADGSEIKLDEVLGNRFALLACAADPVAAFAQLAQPVWDRLAPARVALLPDGMAFPAPVPGVEVVREIGSALTAMAPPPLLLRPDHYVAAVLGDPAGDAARFAELLDATWR
jgi:3-(3-hydroxy-phenyl)propionate hydroxylase